MLYELHVGAFSAEGTFDGLRRKLDYLADLGVTAIELMPLSEFAGTRNWGYDGVMPFAPDAAYGSPDDLKRLIDEAHGRGLMMFLDVVYNHFGPVGNYLHRYAETSSSPRSTRPGAPRSITRSVRCAISRFHNVLYWLEEFRFDGLRFDAVDRIIDRGEEHILKEIAATVRRTIPAERHVHLVLENDKNQAHLLERDQAERPVYYDAQWNDDIHHVYHHLLTGEAGGYYADYASGAHERLAARSAPASSTRATSPSTGTARCAASRAASAADRLRRVHPEPRSGRQPRVRRAHRGSRRARSGPGHAGGALLLAPQIPLLFMGEEWGATQPFCFFTDFHDELADAVREGRRREFRSGSPSSPAKRRARTSPDPNALSTFAASRLDWSVPEQPEHRAWLELVRRLIRIRHEMIVPRLGGVRGHAGKATILSDSALRVAWTLADGSTLELIANLADRASPVTLADEVGGDVLFANHPDLPAELRAGRLPPWSVLWLLHPRAS